MVYPFQFSSCHKNQQKKVAESNKQCKLNKVDDKFFKSLAASSGPQNKNY